MEPIPHTMTQGEERASHQLGGGHSDPAAVAAKQRPEMAVCRGLRLYVLHG